ncbi:TraI domain-containing protein [Methylomonas sp. LL1]|uniref:MobH family relaxase n=1 Tax=Methylomonas sp. LL1 TaxID=2785785 RepID=UPI0018C3DFB4|nr:MobH family relaxase [Methylomonas sp. LL1]QPK61626.1 TraI domain-containing protein [Methylomonas sp. LL1]
MENTPSTLIARIRQRLFGVESAPVAQVATTMDEDVPRYPPFMKGLPAAPVERILTSQTELIASIEQALAMPDSLYQTIAAPVIRRYAAFSHLLPASESHHHRGAGGLFRHGLEVAHWATLASQGSLFATSASPKERKAQELRWRLAVCFAGLLHDIGKPVADIAVVDAQGQHTWNPCDENITDWALRNEIDRYFLRWRDNRHKRHEQFSALVIERVLTREARTFILESGPDIMQAMLETINGLDRGSKVYALVITADCKSVERDLKAHYQNIDSALGMPVEKYLFDAMRRLVKSGQWTVNEKGARLWRFEDGLHIVWRAGAQDIVTLLAKDKVPGIPRDEDTLADILIERGLAIPKSWPDGRQYRYWQMQPEGLDNPLYLLRLKSAELIFSGEPPTVVAAHEINEPDVNATAVKTEPVTNQAQHISKLAKTKNVAALKQSQRTDNPKPVEPKEPQIEPAHDTSAELDLPVLESAPGISNSLPSDPDQGVSQSKSADGAPSLCHTEQPKNAPPAKPTNTEKTDSTAKPNCSTTDTKSISSPIDTAKCWLENHGDGGQWLMDIASMLNQGQWQLGSDILEVQDKYLLPFPATAEKLAIEPPQFIKMLEETGWLVTDILSPMRKVQTIQSVRGILLTLEPSLAIKALLKSQDETRPSVLSAPPPSDSTDNVSIQVPSSKPHKRAKPESKVAQLPPKVSGDQQPSNGNASDISVKSNVDKSNAPQATTPAKPGTIDLLITHVRQQNIPPDESSPDRNWHSVSNTELDRFLAQHPTVKRTRLMLEIANHPDCRSVSATEGIKVRLRP